MAILRSLTRTRLSPTSAAAGVVHRMLMAGSLRRVAGHRARSAVAIATALKTTALGRGTREERAWVMRIEERRRELDSGKEFAEVVLGSAAAATPGSEGDRLVKDMVVGCRWISIPPMWGRFLISLLRELTPRSCVELGTGFGISAAYQAAALDLNGAGRLTTLEASRECVSVAERGLSRLGLEHRVDVCRGPIGETLPGVMKGVEPVDYVFVDADHTEEATVAHFDTMLPHLAGGAVVLFDDINWTKEMTRAWSSIRRDERVSRAVGLGRVGIALLAPRV